MRLVGPLVGVGVRGLRAKFKHAMGIARYMKYRDEPKILRFCPQSVLVDFCGSDFRAATQPGGVA